MWIEILAILGVLVISFLLVILAICLCPQIKSAKMPYKFLDKAYKRLDKERI